MKIKNEVPTHLVFLYHIIYPSERNSVLDVLLYICDRHSFLLHRVTLTDCYATVLNAVVQTLRCSEIINILSADHAQQR